MPISQRLVDAGGQPPIEVDKMLQFERNTVGFLKEREMKLYRTGWAAIIFSVAVLQATPSALAQGAPEPKAAAETFLNGLDSGDLGSLYDQSVATRSRQYLTKDNFVQSINVWRIQSGGPVQSRLFVGATPLTQLQDGTKGDFYYVRYREGYPSSQIFVDITLEHQGQNWLIVAYYFSPVPPQQQ
jgi:Protein of unknown function (DUF4019)